MLIPYFTGYVVACLVLSLILYEQGESREDLFILGITIMGTSFLWPLVLPVVLGLTISRVVRG